MYGVHTETEGKNARISWSLAGHGRAREAIGLGLLLLALAGLFGRIFVSGVIGHQRDTSAFYYPLTAWFADELQAGRFPLWCPLIFGGYPIFADGEIGMLYPPKLLALLALPVELAFTLTHAVHYLIAALGAYALARVLGVGRAAAALAGLCFALGGFMVGHLDHPNVIRSAAWLPAILWCGELALRARGRRTLGWIGLAAASLGLAGLGLHPQILLIDLVALWVYLPTRALCGTEPATSRMPGILEVREIEPALRAIARTLAILGAITILGLAGAASQLLPTYELGVHSSRGDGLTYAQASAGALSPFDLLTLVLPQLFRADLSRVWSLHPYWETTLFVGIVGLVLAPIGLVLGRRRAVLPPAMLALVGLALAMGPYAPIDVYGWLWTLPGFSSMRAPARYGLVIELALALLAGVGLDRLAAYRGSGPARRVIGVVSTLGLGILAGLVTLRVWIGTDVAGSLEAIRVYYIALSHDRPSLTAERVRDGLLATLDLANPSTLLALSVFLLAIVLLRLWWQRPSLGRGWQIAALGLALAELLYAAHTFHPTAPLSALTEPSGSLNFLSGRHGQDHLNQAHPGQSGQGLWRAFIVGRSDDAITSRPAQFGVAQPYGYSSLPTERIQRYWTRVNDIDDELLDLWNGRYVVVTKGRSEGIWAQDVLIDPARPLLEGPTDSPLGEETFRVTPTGADALRLLSTLEEAPDLPDGTAVAELTIDGPDQPSERITIRAGSHTAYAAYDEPGVHPAHSRATVGHHWAPRDPSGRMYPRNIYVAEIPLAGPRVVERVHVRAVLPTGRFRLTGLALRDRRVGETASLLSIHRAKYSLVYDSERTAIYENSAAMPRAFVVTEAVTVESDDWALVHLTDRRFDPRRQVLLERPLPGSDGPIEFASIGLAPRAAFAAASSTVAPEQPGLENTATIERYEPNRIVVRAWSPRGGHLVLTDSFYPGWRATVDGQAVPVTRANFLFRAVALPPGEHLVEFTFSPTSLHVGLAVSLCGWLTMAGLAVIGLHQRRLATATR